MDTIPAKVITNVELGYSRFGYTPLSIVRKELEKLATKHVVEYISSVIGIDYSAFSYLGRGAYGEVYLLPDNSVIKVTGSSLEAECVIKLFNEQESTNTTIHDSFPVIYEYGMIDNLYGFDTLYNVFTSYDKELHIITTSKGFVYPFPIFWYRREDVTDVTKAIAFDSALDKIYQTSKGINLRPLDMNIRNIGVVNRNGEDIVVMRDLVCRKEEGGNIDEYEGQLYLKRL